MIIIIDVVIVVFMEKVLMDVNTQITGYEQMSVCLLFHDKILCVKLSLDISYWCVRP